VSPSKAIAGEKGLRRTNALTTTAEHDNTAFERLRVRINRGDPAFAEQIVYRIAGFIVDGALEEGARMPTLDVAAQHVRVNRHVMGLAYQLLARFGMSTNSTGSGTYLTSNAEQAARRYLCAISARKLVHEARLLELRDEEIIGLILAALEPNQKQTSTESGTEE
jgi:DNA-binding transcriptional regulator YhcF (GntR family)